MTDQPEATPKDKPEASTPEPTSTPAPEPVEADGTASPSPADPAAPSGDAPDAASPAEAPRKKSTVNNPYIWGTGRRKASVARVRIRPGDGKFLINKRELDEFFRLDKDRFAARKPLEVTDTVKSFDVFVNVHGGGLTGQAGAVSLGLARALVGTDPEHQLKLKEHNLMSRDARRVERKKYGQRGARRRFQFSKR